MFAAVLPSNVRLRPQSEQDREFLGALYASARENELANVPWPPEAKAAFLRSQFDAQTRHYESAYRGARFDIIERDGQPIGRFCVLETQRELRVVDIVLVPDVRGQGLGAALIRELQTHGKPIALSVEVSNPARRLYERLGFAKTEDGEIYLKMEWRP